MHAVSHFSTNQSRAYEQDLHCKPHANKNFISRTGEIALGYLKQSEGVKNVCKIVSQTIGWLKYHKYDVPKNMMNLQAVTSDGKNVISTAELPEKTYKLGGKIKDLTNTRSLSQVPGNVKNVVSAGASLTGPATDAFKLATAKNIVKASAETIKKVDTIGFAGLALGTTISSLEEVNKIAKLQAAHRVHFLTDEQMKERSHKVILSLLNVNKFMSYSILGTFGLLTNVGGVVLAPWLMPAAATSALLFNVGGYFYGKLNNIESK